MERAKMLRSEEIIVIAIKSLMQLKKLMSLVKAEAILI
nr:MAG TPA: hypothetical protein [Caudoviricetes sp.]